MITVETDEATDGGRVYNIRLSGTVANVILVGAVGFLKKHSALRYVSAAISVPIVASGVFIFVTGSRFDLDLPWGDASIGISQAMILLGAGVGLLFLSVISGKRFNVFVGKLKEVVEREQAEVQIAASPDPFASLDLAHKRLNEYYAINQAQARGSFGWAVFAMFVGLSTIVAGIWIFYLRDTPDTFLTSLSTAAGIVINVISGLYLYLHNKTQRRSLFYVNQLVRLQNLGLAIRLAERYDDESQRTAAVNRVIDEILNIVKSTAIEDSKTMSREGH